MTQHRYTIKGVAVVLTRTVGIPGAPGSYHMTNGKVVCDYPHQPAVRPFWWIRVGNKKDSALNLKRAKKRARHMVGK